MDTSRIPPWARKLLSLPEPPEPSDVPAAAKPVRRSHWWTPWSWVSADGIYIGDDGAWLYRQLPLALLASDGLTTMVCDPAIDGQRLHLLLHAWSAPIEEASLRTTGTDLDDYLADTIRLYSPVRRLIVGVRLPDRDTETSTLSAVYATIDRVLGEHVPNLDAHDADLEVLDRWLAGYGATACDRVATDMLEAWYTLGHPTPTDADETETNIQLGGGSLLTFATGNPDPTSDLHPPAPPLPPGARSAVVASARFTARRDGVDDLGLVYGRRALGAAPWVDTLRRVMPAANVSGLPLRQLPALDETLPCSKASLNPSPRRAGIHVLRQAGFTNPTPVGDPSGLLLGMGGVGYTDPVRFNPLSGGVSRLTIYGASSAGKTFLAEHIAHQGMLAGLTVRYLSGDGDAGRITVDAGAAAVIAPFGGMFDPGRLPNDFTTYRRAVLAGVASATPQVDASVFERVSLRTLPDAATILPALRETPSLVYSPREAALLRRATAQPNTLAWAAMRDGEPFPSGSTAWSVPHILDGFIDEYGTREAAEELLACAALLAPVPQDSHGLLLIVDGVPTGTLFDLACRAAADTGRTLGIVATATKLPPRLAGFSLLGPGLEPQDVSRSGGPELLDASLAGQRAYAEIDAANVVVSAATFTAVDRDGRFSPVVAAPVGAHLLAGLSRRDDAIYK